MFDDCVAVEVLYPETVDQDDGNESSLCVRLTYGKCTFLFPGDAESMAEKTMLGSGVNLDADVLKVAHHGSSTSCSAAFIDAVSPDAAVISVGKDNNYGHPSGKTLSTFAARGIPVWRTDENGSVTFLSDGERIYLASSDGGDELALKAA